MSEAEIQEREKMYIVLKDLPVHIVRENLRRM